MASPAAPTGVAGSYVSQPSEVNLSWNLASDCTGYNVYRSTTPGVLGSIVNSGAADISPHFTLVIDEQWLTPCAEGQFASVYGASWNWYANNTNDTSANNNGTNSGYNNNCLSVISDGVNPGGILNVRQHVAQPSDPGYHAPWVGGGGTDLNRDWGAAIFPRMLAQGLSNTNMLYGRREVRMNIPVPKQGWHEVPLWWNVRYDLPVGNPSRLVWPVGGETDWPEGDATSTNVQPFMHWYGATSGSQQDTTNTNKHYTTLHTYVDEWTPGTGGGKWVFKVDGVTQMTSQGSHVNSTDNMRSLLQFETRLSNSSRPIVGQDNNIQVYWVRFWTYH